MSGDESASDGMALLRTWPHVGTKRGVIHARKVDSPTPPSRRVADRFVDVPHVRILPHPIDAAYAWLTDYRDDDAALAGAIIQERGVERRADGVIVLSGHNVTLGQHARGRAEVHLFPAEYRWEARIFEGSGRGSVYTYALTPLPDGRTRLEVHYRIRARRLRKRLLLWVVKPLISREVRKMWDGFAGAMGRELA